MSYKKFCQTIELANVNPVERKAFPEWVRHYQSWLEIKSGDLPVTFEVVSGFCQFLLKTNTRPLKCLQAVKAIVAYRDLVLTGPFPSLEPIVAQLEQLQDKNESHLQEPSDQNDASNSFLNFSNERHGAIRPDVTIDESKDFGFWQRLRKKARLYFVNSTQEKVFINCIKDWSLFQRHMTWSL